MVLSSFNIVQVCMDLTGSCLLQHKQMYQGSLLVITIAVSQFRVCIL